MALTLSDAIWSRKPFFSLSQTDFSCLKLLRNRNLSSSQSMICLPPSLFDRMSFSYWKWGSVEQGWYVSHMLNLVNLGIRPWQGSTLKDSISATYSCFSASHCFLSSVCAYFAVSERSTALVNSALSLTLASSDSNSFWTYSFCSAVCSDNLIQAFFRFDDNCFASSCVAMAIGGQQGVSGHS